MPLFSSNVRQQRVLEIAISTLNGAQTGNMTALGYRREGLTDVLTPMSFVAPAAGLTQNVEMGDAWPDGVTLIRFIYTIGA